MNASDHENKVAEKAKGLCDPAEAKSSHTHMKQKTMRKYLSRHVRSPSAMGKQNNTEEPKEPQHKPSWHDRFSK
jgi:hypothetical protein